MVSIVLPVYNGEKYLASALNSVLSQSYHDWELIVVDDGSVDATASVCDYYTFKDARIKAFHQPNGGVNLARAKGVEEACGEYLVFLDADDTLMDDALEFMVSSITNDADLLAEGSSERILGNEEYLIKLWKGEIGPALWGKMFRTEVYRKIDYSLDRRMAMGEDLLLNSIYALNVRQVIVLPRKVYRVNRHNEASVTKTFKHTLEYEKYYFGVVDELFLKKCKKANSYEQIEMLVYKSRLNALKYIMLQGGDIDYKDSWFKETRSFFRGKWKCLGPSEKLIFLVRNPSLYRKILKTYLKKV